MKNKQTIWSERYRPKTVDECILPTDLKAQLTDILKQGAIPNMLFSGTAGLGKTTVARAICNELEADYLMINGSEDSGIDVLRTKIRQFASTRSLIDSGSQHKIVILDEADYLNPSSTQPALRAFLEEFSSVCRFIFTCNFRNRIIEPLHSRCTCVDFTTDKKVQAELSKQFFARTCKILTENEIEFDKKDVANVIVQFAPDWRRVLNECQRYSSTGTFTPNSTASLSDTNVNELINFLKSKNFKEMRKWVAVHGDMETSVLFRKLYDTIAVKAEPKSIPAAVLIIAEYQYRAAFVSDREINVTACLTELMRDLTWL